MIRDERKVLGHTWWLPTRNRIRSRIAGYQQRSRVAVSRLAAIGAGIDPRTRRLNEYGRPIEISKETA